MAEHETKTWRVEERLGEPSSMTGQAFSTTTIPFDPPPSYWLTNDKEGFRMVNKFVAEALAAYLNERES